MKPLKLILQGFGAFPDTTEIDFEQCGSDSLFLVCGPTGAGKTTIFDGLCYALFGESTGKRQSSDMRSQHASPKVKSFVDFSFSLGTNIFQLYREVSYETEDKKVDGKVVLKILDKAGNEKQAPLTKKRDVEAYLNQLLGMSAYEFRQIVMLPQGEFEKFLLAKSSDRENILGNLFRTSFYALIAGKLLEKAKTLKQLYDGMQSKNETLLQGGGVLNIEELDERLKKLTNEAQTLKNTLPDIHNSVMEARNKRVEAEQLEKSFVEYTLAEENLSQHIAEENDIKTKETFLQRANIAEQFRPIVAEIENVQGNIKKTKNKIDNFIKENGVHQSRLQVAESKLKAFESRLSEMNNLQSDKQTLQRLLPRMKELDEIIKEINSTADLLSKAKNEQNELQKESEQKQTRVDEIHEQLPVLHSAVKEKGRIEARIKDLMSKIKLAEEKQSVASDLVKLVTEVKLKFKAVENAAKRKLKSDKEFHGIELRWRKSQAARLAIELQPQQPCPVCGSVEHPSPAPKTDDFVTTESLDMAKQTLESAMNEWEEAKRIYDEVNNKNGILVQKLQMINEQLGSYSVVDIAILQKEKNSSQAEVEACIAKESSIGTLTKEAELCSKRLKQIAKEKSEIDSKIVTYGSLQASREEKARGIRSEIPIGIASSADLESRVSKFEKELDNYEKDKKKVQQDRERLNTQCTEVSTRLDESRNQQTELEKRLLELSDKLTKKLTGAKFHTVDDVKTYLVENDEREAMDRALDKWKNKKIQLETKQKEILKNVKGKSRPDLDGFRRIEDELDNKEKETHNSITSIQERIKMDKNLLSQVKEGHKEILKIHSETTRLDNLARIANGDNNRKQPLQTFVLTAFLEDVIAAANLRLARFTHKRYELTRRLDPTGRQKKSGLDINVFDNYTGEERPAHTLSGGEMFLTSLSLALGLADVVSVHSGGFKLDAMFIDEGFGSLDDQTLDVAIQALIDLKEDGRIIGIISHVNELKERIPLRLEVIKSRKGSSVRWSRN